MAAYDPHRMGKYDAQDSLLAEQQFSLNTSRDVSPHPRGYTEGFAEPSQYAGGYYQREGYLPSSPTTAHSGWRIYRPDSKWTWSFFLIAVFQAAIGLALEG